MVKNILIKYFVFAFILSFVPSFAFAANIYLGSTETNVRAGDTFIVSLMVDPEGAAVNTIEGDVAITSEENNFVVNDFSLSKSIFTLWPKTPSLSPDESIISFVGGVPGGFSAGKALVFNIVIETDKEGDILFSPKNMAIFANDGSGTRIPTTVSNLTVKVGPKDEAIATNNEWVSLVNADKINPEEFVIALGQESSMFEGKRFAFFTAIDNQSGISYYEVVEDGKEAVRSGSMYVLANQDPNKTPNLKVTAYDKAGNKTIAVYKQPGFTIYGFSLNFFIIIAIIFIVWFIFRKIRRSRKNRINVQNTNYNQ